MMFTGSLVRRAASSSAAGLRRSTPQRASAAAMNEFSSYPSEKSGIVPDCAVTFGHNFQMTFMSNPAVMAVANILELQGIVQMRANFTPENIEAMMDFDEDLARKAQIAMDNGLAINFKDMEQIEENLPRLLLEKKQLEAARAEIFARKVGDYGPLKADISATKPQSLQFTLSPAVLEKLKGKK